ncbi:MAG: riboflavin kinase [Candidatus Paceibacterota bacterium]|jgi:FAD synthase
MNYVISGQVLKGDSYGRKIGFPTVNLKTEAKDVPPNGVYAGTGTLEGKTYRAGIVIGPGDRIEAHLIGYDGDAYGKEVVLQINKFLREFKKFDTEEELIAQIKKDLKYC